ncbi:MAG: protein kinase [Phycisphaerales bacterium JB065]
MNRRENERATDIFVQAVEMEPDQRDAFVAEACGSDPGLRRVVDKLLRSDESPCILDSPLDFTFPAVRGDSEKDDDVVSVGPYSIKRLISRGGMGSVYLAVQANPTRDVALKVIEQGADRQDGFSLESRALGRLQHPNIARVYEAGIGELQTAGVGSRRVPFVAMEYVKGRTLQEVIADGPLSRAALAQTLLSLAQAIEHAHRRGVIHRDLKPANVIISEDGTPHIIDFGIGMLTTGADKGLTTSDRSGGTVAYMPPEQLVGQVDRIDIRADIYALGAIAYEAALGERLNRSAGTIDDALYARLTGAARFRRRDLVQGVGRELALIIERATAVEPDDRYPSASALVADIRCVIEGRALPGEQVPALRAAQLFVRRHKFASSAAAVAASTVVLAVVVMAAATVRSSQAAARADAALLDAQREAVHAEELAEFLKASFLGVDPEERGAAVTLFDAIDYAAGRVDRDLRHVPAAEADVRFALGFVYRRHGRLEEALDQVDRSHRLRTTLYGADDVRTLEVTEEVGYLAWLYEGDMERALSMLEDTLSVHHAAGRAGSATDAWIRIKLASVLLAKGLPEAAERHLMEAEPIMMSQYGVAFTARPVRHRAMATLHRGDLERAESLARKATELCVGVPEQEYIVARCHATLAEILMERGELQESGELLDTAEQQFAALLTPESLELAHVEYLRAIYAYRTGNREALTRHARTAAAMRAGVLRPRHPQTLLADAWVALGVATGEEAEDRRLTINAAVGLLEEVYPDGHFELDRFRKAAGEWLAASDLGATAALH